MPPKGDLVGTSFNGLKAFNSFILCGNFCATSIPYFLTNSLLYLGLHKYFEVFDSYTLTLLSF